MARAEALCQRLIMEDRVLTGPTIAVAETTAQTAQIAGKTQTLTSEGLLEKVLASLENDKAEEIVEINLRGKSSMADYMVIASGRSSRQVGAIAEKLVDSLKQDHGILCKMEGKQTGDWVLIDTGDVIVHVFRPEVREFYQIEKMWMPEAAAQTSQ